MNKYVRSDLAAECGAARDGEGVRVTRAEVSGCDILRVQVKSDAASARLGKPCGRYVTLECGNVHELDEVGFEEVRRALSVELREMAERASGKRVGTGFSVLVVGLGNADMTPDAVGPETVRRLSVTRHLRRLDGALFSTVGLCEIAAIAPGTPGQTGLETVELIAAAVEAVTPDLVLLVDALAARSTARLAATVQLSDAGIQPGSGIGRRQRAISAQTLGVPVVTVGVPTVVESSTLIADALASLGILEKSDEIGALLDHGRGMFVSPKEIDLLVSSVGVLLAGAIEKAFSV